MGNKTVEVRPVGAWVQPEADMTGYEHHHGVVLARQEENRLCHIQKEKEERLRKFQEEVKRRVKVLDQAKKRKMIEKSVKEIEMERNVVRQSAFGKGRSSPRKDSCTLRKHNNLTLQPPHKGADRVAGCHRPDPGFTDQSQKAVVVAKQARKNLVSRQVITEDFTDGNTLYKNFNTEPVAHSERDRRDDKGRHDTDADRLSGVCEELDQVRLGQRPGDSDVRGDKQGHSPHSTRSSCDRKTRLKSGKLINSKVPEIYDGVVTQDEKRRKQVQHAMYRRLFMDIEREQVKENLRRKEHRKRIARLKEEKEECRREEEAEARHLVEPRDPVTGETEEETLDRERMEQVQLSREMKQRQARLQKVREMERYLDALKYRLRERIKDREIELPALCCCGNTLWDTNPDTCANNCVFYKNPKGYGRALQSLLSSFDVL
ncbi:coiled-coil domain-containing protein 15-like [Liolophura sinensis]|uniref:coiled-coil domain-containing protein 15-like n=1 Tax=Liolophura sinensis TaxID=3198878 RepID=UPI0031589EE9